jgi:predicted unusual protein kinase regulating ubiquinone biosynthesis (AarF/ABC1/UbiB family)
VQTDPNYGNFLYREETGQLVLLDFGAVQSFPASFRDDYRELLALALENDRDGLIDKGVAMQLMDGREAPEVQAQFADLVQLVGRMFVRERQPFDFGGLAHLEETRTTLMAFARNVRFSPPPKQIAFLNRKLGGMYHLLKDAGSRIDLAPFAERVLGR